MVVCATGGMSHTWQSYTATRFNYAAFVAVTHYILAAPVLIWPTPRRWNPVSRLSAPGWEWACVGQPAGRYYFINHTDKLFTDFHQILCSAAYPACSDWTYLSNRIRLKPFANGLNLIFIWVTYVYINTHILAHIHHIYRKPVYT
jgi:hypothetical protein